MRKLLTRLIVGALIANVLIMGSVTPGIASTSITDQTNGTGNKTNTSQINDTEEGQTGVVEDQIGNTSDGQDETVLEDTEGTIPSETGETSADNTPTGTGRQTPVPTQESPGFGAFLTIVIVILGVYIMRRKR